MVIIGYLFWDAFLFAYFLGAMAVWLIPAGEKKRLQKLQVFIRNLQIRTYLFANSSSNFYPVTAYLPKERDSVASELQPVCDTVSEEEMAQYRRDLKALG